MPRVSDTESIVRRVSRRWLARGVAVATLAVTLATGRGAAQHRIPGPDPEHPRLRFADSLDSRNHRCMVSKAKLNPAMGPIYVNGEPIGFC